MGGQVNYNQKKKKEKSGSLMLYVCYFLQK